jgi:hypothetical protein
MGDDAEAVELESRAHRRQFRAIGRVDASGIDEASVNSMSFAVAQLTAADVPPGC